VLINPGDEVVFSIPPWFFYEPMVLLAGAVPIKVPVRADNHDLDVDRIAGSLTPKTRMVIVNTPNNPTGRIYPAETLRGLAEVLTDASDRFGAPIHLLSDEPYARLVFGDAEMLSPVAFYPNTLISYSYGKVLLTPGERIGWLALGPELADRELLRGPIELAQMANGWRFPGAVLQHSIAALEGLSIDMKELTRKRDVMGIALQEMGYELTLPEGTFYLWVKSPDQDDTAFCERLAERGVLTLPGTICEGPGYFRISLTATMEMIERALPVFAAARG
jgi:aspartate aminotransferase